MSEIVLESENGYGWAIVPQGQQPTKAHVTTLRTTRGFGWSAERGNGSGPLPDVPPELIVGNIVLVGSSIDHVPGEWEPGVDVEGEYVRRANGTGPWLATGITSGPYIAQTVADVVTWREIGTDANGGRTTVYAQPFATVYAEPVVVTPATLTGALLPGEPYTSTAATFSGFPEPEVSHGVQRQLGTTGAIETVGANGMRAVGYRYRPATRGYSLAGEVWSYGDGWSAVIAPPAVAPTVSLARTPAGAVTQGDSVTITATRTGTPDPTPVWTITRNGAPFTTPAGAWERVIDDIEDGDYVVSVTVTNSAGSATDTMSFTVAAASTDVAPYVITNPAMPALTAGVPVTVPAATFGGNPPPTSVQKIQRRLPPSGTPEDVVTGLTFTPAANYQYSRASTATNGVGSPAVANSAWSDTVPQVDWAFVDDGSDVIIPVYPGQPNTLIATNITSNSAELSPGPSPTPAVTHFTVLPSSDFNAANPHLSAMGNAAYPKTNRHQNPIPATLYTYFREGAPVSFRTLPSEEFVDNFDGATGSLAGHVSDMGGTWGAGLTSGAMTINIGRLRGTSISPVEMHLSSYELSADGGYLEAEVSSFTRIPGALGFAPLAINANNHLIVQCLTASAGSASDAITITERRGGTAYPLLSHSMPGFGDGSGDHVVRVVVDRDAKEVLLTVNGASVGIAPYVADYPVGTKIGARWAAASSTYPTTNGGVQFKKIAGGGL